MYVWLAAAGALAFASLPALVNIVWYLPFNSESFFNIALTPAVLAYLS